MYVQEVASSKPMNIYPKSNSYQLDGMSTQRAQKWHDTLYEDTLYLLSIINTFSASMPDEIVDMGLNGLNEIEQRVNTLDCPEAVQIVRWHLLNAISDMSQALNYTLSAQQKRADAYNHAAKIEMGFFDIELLRLGLS